MGKQKFCQIIAMFCMVCTLNSPSISISMAQAAVVNFRFPQFIRCNTSEILCVNDATISGHEIHLTNSTNARYKLTNTTVGRIVYNQTIQLSSLASLTTEIEFVMKYYNRSSDDYGGDGIAFFMASKEIATQLTWYSNGLPGNESLSDNTFGVEFSSYRRSHSRVFIDVGILHPFQVSNGTSLNESLNHGRLRNVRIDWNVRKNYLQVFIFNASNSSISQRNLVLEYPFDCSKYLLDNFVVGISTSASYSSETHTILSWSFNTTTKTKSFKKIIILTTVGAFLCLTVTAVIFSIAKKKRRLGSNRGQTCEDNEIEIDMNVDHGPCRYKLEDLRAGTNNFSETLKLGKGGFGDVYKAILEESNEVVAVKRISERSRQGIKEFISEVSIVSRVRHRNLVQLFGWCHEKGQLLLVYEYMSNGSLDKHLFNKGDSPPLQWSHRYRIALEIACGLMYLHEEWDHCIVHRDVKCSNVMLGNNFNAKLGDFGLARMLERNRLSQTTIVAGTFGYLAPECVITGRTSPESDVYSFGAVALEIATGRRAIDTSLQEHNMRLVEWVWDLYGQGKVLEAADWRLNGEFEKEEMDQLIGIGLWCSHPDPVERPKITQVVKLLKLEAQVPQLPLALPIPTYARVQRAKLSVASSFTTDPSQAFPYCSSTFSHSTASSSSVAVGTSGATTQVSSSSNSSTLPMVACFQKQA